MTINRILLLVIVLSIWACREGGSNEAKPLKWVQLKGSTMGTTYAISVQSAEPQELKKYIDSALVAFNEEVSTYIAESTISQFNQTSDSFWVSAPKQPHFVRNLLKANELYALSEGYFDPTVMPLVNHWGFGYEQRSASIDTSQATIDALMESVGLDGLQIEQHGDSILIVKPNAAAQLDFSASAKGDGVDLVADILEKYGNAQNYLVEIGGEVYARGLSPKSKPWVLGINRPSEEAQRTDFIEKIQLSGAALATSGNYRNFFRKNGITFSHTINPKTGRIERNSLLSASVIAEDCLTADALATACMTMGAQACKEAAEQWEDVELFLVYVEQDSLNTYYSPGFEEFLTQKQ